MTQEDLCTNRTSIASDGAATHLAAVLCKRWSCPYCAQVNRWRVISEAIAGKPRRLLTLTVSSTQYPDPAEAASALKRGLRLLRLRLQRHPTLEDFSFLAVFEAHKSGAPHLHLLVRGKFLPWQKLRQWWEEITGSTHIDIRAIKGRKDAARYVAKYLGKDLHAFPGCKRYWRSHGYPKPANDNELPTRNPVRPIRLEIPFYEALDRLEWQGWTVTRKRGRRADAIPPPTGDGPAEFAILRDKQEEAGLTPADAWLPSWARP